MVIDFHTHTALVPKPEHSPERAVAMLEANGVDGALLTPHHNLMSTCIDPQQENDAIVELCARMPGKLFPAICVNPLAGQAALDEIRRCKETHNSNVLKLHPWLQGFPVTSPVMNAVAEVCQELGLAIIFHDGTPIYSHASAMARLCRDFPELVVIAGHAGLGDLWREAMLSAQRYPNFILCLCGPREAAIREIVENVRPEQLCVGSDLMLSDADDVSVWFRWNHFRAVDMPEETRRTIEQETPARILGVK